MLHDLKHRLRSFRAKLALVYVGLFSLSVILLFTFIFTFATRYINSQIEDSIRVRFDILQNEYRENGSPGLEARIREFINSDEEGVEIYLLTTKEGERLAGNLQAWPERAVKEGKYGRTGEWITFKIEGTKNNPDPIEVKALTISISKWRNILIGQNLQSKHKVEQTIIQTFWASLLVTVLMAFIGAYVITRSVMRRLTTINRSADRIISGELSARIPFDADGDEFDQLSSNLNKMLDRIQMLLTSLGQFANNIAHDLRSPLNRIIARTEAGLRGLKEQSAARRLLESNVQEMEELVGTFNSILRISELEANPDFRNFEECDLVKILRNLIELYEPYAADKHIAFKHELPEQMLLMGEKNLLNQAFANLLDNAVKFTPENGAINIAAEQNGPLLQVTIADSGPGIPDAYHNRVFEKFFRLESSRHTKGNGLGLSMVAAVARIHNASLKLENLHPGLKITLSFFIYHR